MTEPHSSDQSDRHTSAQDNSQTWSGMPLHQYMVACGSIVWIGSLGHIEPGQWNVHKYLPSQGLYANKILYT